MITSINAEPTIGGGSFILSWTSNAADPTFRVFRDAILIATTKASRLTVALPAGVAVPVFEVLDDPAARPSPAYPGYVVLAWYATPATASYLVEQYVGSAWVKRQNITDNGAGYFTWRSDSLADATAFQFRVKPIGNNGNAGTATVFNFLMVRHPDPPKVKFGYDAVGHTVTIVAA